MTTDTHHEIKIALPATDDFQTAEVWVEFFVNEDHAAHVTGSYIELDGEKLDEADFAHFELTREAFEIILEEQDLEENEI